MRIAIPAFLLAAALLRGQSIELQSGEIVAGQVTAITETALTITTGYPTTENRVFARAEIAPRSWFALHQARANPKDPAAHLQLATLAEQLELPGHAIAELQQAAVLDAALRAEVERRISALRVTIAADLLAMARDADDAGKHGEARLTAQVVAEKYGDTPSAAAARELIAKATAQLRTTPPRTDPADAKAVANAAQLEQKADKIAPTTGGGVGPTVQETRQREQAAKLLEQALATLMRADGNEAEMARQRVRTKLRDQYLALATNLLQRRALDRATEYNGMACALDPDSGGCHHLQDLIVQARLTFGY